MRQGETLMLLAIAISLLFHIFLPEPRSGWNKPADYDIFFEAQKFVFTAGNRCFYQNSGRVLERRCGQKSRSGQSDFGYRHNRRFKLGRILAAAFRLFVLFQSLLAIYGLPALRSVSPESITLYLENICLIITSICFSLMLAPCME